MKKIILITFLLFINSCGYKLVHNNFGEKNYQINITQMRGDRQINNLIKKQIDLYSNKNSKNKFDVTINSKYQKKVLAKDSAGIISDYQLSVNSTFEIYTDSMIIKKSFIDTVNIKNRSDAFEQKQYEVNIKNNLASSIGEKLISEISTLK